MGHIGRIWCHVENPRNLVSALHFAVTTLRPYTIVSFIAHGHCILHSCGPVLGEVFCEDVLSGSYSSDLVHH